MPESFNPATMPRWPRRREQALKRIQRRICWKVVLDEGPAISTGICAVKSESELRGEDTSQEKLNLSITRV